MSDQPAPSRQEDLASGLKEGPGQRLCSARQARGLALEDIAAELHLKPSVIAALEHDRYEELPAPVFVTGYVRGYARLLDMDPEPLVADLRSAGSLREPRRPRLRRTGEAQVRSRSRVARPLSVALALAVAGLAFAWWLQRTPGPALLPPPEYPAKEEAPAEPMVLEQTAGQPPVAEPLAPAIGDEPAEPAPVQGPGAVLATAPEAEAPREQRDTATAPASPLAGEADEQPASKQTEVAPETPATGEILIEFNGPSWVDIRDSERNYKLLGEMKKGDRHVLGGKPPYSLIIGNASAVQVRIAGAPFDLNAVAKGNVARFTLDPENLP